MLLLCLGTWVHTQSKAACLHHLPHSLFAFDARLLLMMTQTHMMRTVAMNIMNIAIPAPPDTPVT